jgi:hypothetical protein
MVKPYMARGLVIVIMAIDHVRDDFNFGGEPDPMANPAIGAALFFTRSLLRTSIGVSRGHTRRLDDVAQTCNRARLGVPTLAVRPLFQREQRKRPEKHGPLCVVPTEARSGAAVHLRASRYGGQPSPGLPTVAHANVGTRERR